MITASWLNLFCTFVQGDFCRFCNRHSFLRIIKQWFIGFFIRERQISSSVMGGWNSWDALKVEHRSTSLDARESDALGARSQRARSDHSAVWRQLFVHRTTNGTRQNLRDVYVGTMSLFHERCEHVAEFHTPISWRAVVKLVREEHGKWRRLGRRIPVSDTTESAAA